MEKKSWIVVAALVCSFSEYGAIPLALAAGMIFPAVYYLLKIGKNEVKVSSF